MATYEDSIVKGMTGQERNIGANLRRQDRIDNRSSEMVAADRHAEIFNPSVDDIKKENDINQKNLNTAKAKAQKTTSPNFKKVKNYARGGGCEVRGKTKGRMV